MSFKFGLVTITMLPILWLPTILMGFHSTSPVPKNRILSRSQPFSWTRGLPYASVAHISTSTILKSSEGDSVAELSSALAVLDNRWRENKDKTNRWEKIMFTGSDQDSSAIEEFVYLLQPPSNFLRPTSCIFFLGGAALGQYPHIAYSEMLTKLSNSMGTAVIAAPFSTNLDHFELAKKSGELFRKALRKCEDEYAWQENLPLYCLGHSLGAKLTIINIAATGIGEDLIGIGLISYNNFGLTQSIGMARSFLQSLRSGSTVTDSSYSADDSVMNSLFGFVEQITQGIGLEFQPSPIIMERLVSMKFEPTLQSKTRLFCFDEDDLDCSERLIECCEGLGPDTSGLPGTHLTPVYLKLGLDDLSSDLPDEAKQVASQVFGVQSASFGNEDELNSLVREITAWMSGRSPSRKPNWYSRNQQKSDENNRLPSR